MAARRLQKKRKAARRSPAGWRASRAVSPFDGREPGQFASDMKDLLYAALSTAGFAPDRLSSFVADNRSDGGVDAYLDGVPLRPSTLLPGPMVFQFKRSCPSESKLIAELNAPAQERARRLLEAGADYALLVGADVRPESIGLALTRRIGALVAGWRG